MITLADGIHLEESKQILRWGTSREQAWQIGKPSQYGSEDTRLLWEEKIFHGLSCCLLTYLPGDKLLSHVSIWLRPKGGGRAGDDALCAAYDYVEIFRRLSTYLGAPAIQSGPGAIAPLLQWKHDGCLISLGMSDRFGDYITFGIRKGLSNAV
jgi:hypothetical protein